MMAASEVASPLVRRTAEVLAKRQLNFEMSTEGLDWGWAMIDAEAESDALYALTALTPPLHWGELNRLIDQIARDLELPQPRNDQDATRWLAHGHLSDIALANGDDFAALKKVSRLWFDQETPDLAPFYRLKHAIREVETTGQQGHVPGLTQENWKEQLADAAQKWLTRHPLPAGLCGSE
ncbi:hypothetical protein K3X48_10555 [Aliiroseovarius crassostreae]|uniref:Uncharacterized protein n=1 Tax=Aliiroseovarius crassostreae TaxID=154981 RepID=A0A9Q9HC49_9RHOB|nr:hypothetical protein [Aliiroseovarius crassostreae]UWP94655.1 hypothetical protein K3X48_10555 [Aliiroseovarius crassostreae]